MIIFGPPSGTMTFLWVPEENLYSLMWNSAIIFPHWILKLYDSWSFWLHPLREWTSLRLWVSIPIAPGDRVWSNWMINLSTRLDPLKYAMEITFILRWAQWVMTNRLTPGRRHWRSTEATPLTLSQDCCITYQQVLKSTRCPILSNTLIVFPLKSRSISVLSNRLSSNDNRWSQHCTLPCAGMMKSSMRFSLMFVRRDNKDSRMRMTLLWKRLKQSGLWYATFMNGSCLGRRTSLDLSASLVPFTCPFQDLRSSQAGMAWGRFHALVWHHCSSLARPDWR